MKKFISIVTGMTVVCTFFIGCGNTSKTAENGELNIFIYFCHTFRNLTDCFIK